MVDLSTLSTLSQYGNALFILPMFSIINLCQFTRRKASTNCIHYIHEVCVYIIYIYTNLPVSDVVGIPRPWSGDSQGQETFLAPSADKETRNKYEGQI